MEIIKNPNFDFLGKRKICYVFSSLLIISGLILLFIKGEKNFGIDFVGGDLLNVEFTQKTDVVNLRNIIGEIKIGSFTVQELGTEGKNFIIRLPQKTSDIVIEKLKELEEKQKDELLKIQTREYYNFIKTLLAEGAIMSKNFYVIVPFYPLPITPAKGKKEAKASILTQEQFERAKTQLWQRMEFVAHGLRGCGLFCAPLNTVELIELFWSIYHPQEAEVGYYPEVPPELLQ